MSSMSVEDGNWNTNPNFSSREQLEQGVGCEEQDPKEDTDRKNLATMYTDWL
jgi:hypothetical protein